MATLGVLTKEQHRLCVDTFEKGHSFLPGVPDGLRQGGLPNTHYFGRAADIRWVDGKPVEGNGTEADVLEVGEILAGIPPRGDPIR